MDFVRIGDKMISREKIHEAIDAILSRRSKGQSQSEVADALGVDRTFISRLETLGEIRKGGSIALIGFPIANCDEIREVAREEGVDFTLLMTDEERWAFVRQRSGTDLLNELMTLIASVRRFEKVVFIGSDKRLEIMKGLVDRSTEAATIVIGKSPVLGDVYVNPESLRKVIQGLKG
ncbi:MAG TPA: helix-turn-helix transcriptional regulator [Firmicutes bacterium]|nr:helix-turn-helix transcriptional regulator [Candidatus Fermentithermobacillaceae bacterium]